MKWENLTADQFALAVEESKRTIVIPVSIMEKHAHHLPLGTDAFINRLIVERAEEITPFVVAPEVVFAQGSETKNAVGTIALPNDLIHNLLEGLCDECYRNGFEKILLVNGHGGNSFFTRFFAQGMLAKEKPYVVYVVDSWFITKEEEAYLNEKYGVDPDLGHADRDETALVMRYNENVVHMDKYDPKEPHYVPGCEFLFENDIFTPIHWPMSRPNHVTGRPNLACRELGDELSRFHATHMARQIKLIQDDDTVLDTYRKYIASGRYERK